MRVLGVSAGNKESAVAVVENGRLTGALLQERVTRVRRDDSLPLAALHQLLGALHLTLDDIDAVAGNVTAAQLRSALGLPQRPHAPFAAQPSGPEQHGMHHLSHAAATFWTSGLPRALVVTIDNSGDDDTAVAFVGQGRQLQRVAAIPRQPVPIGGVYEQATLQLGFGLGGEGKLMGLAAYGTPRAPWLPELLQVAPTGGNPWQAGLRSPWLADAAHPLQRILRPPWLAWGPDHADFAATIQASLEAAVLALLEPLRREHPGLPLCLGGGVALNCALSGTIARTGWFDQVWVPPSPADPGNAMGAALLWAMRAGEPLPERMTQTGHGPALDPGQVLAAVQQMPGCTVVGVHDVASPAYAQAAATDVAQGKPIAWVHGGSEFGPRALGHRSLVGDPRAQASADACNAAKLREPWRPLAPAVLAEAAPAWLRDAGESAFMLRAFLATDRMRREAPAAVHKDGTARAQTVTTADRPWHDLIAAFGALTGVPMVLNTSLNQAGEPIAHSVADAADFCRRSGVRRLYAQGVVVDVATAAQPIDVRPPKPTLAVVGELTWPWLRELTEQVTLAVVAVQPQADPALHRLLPAHQPATVPQVRLVLGHANASTQALPAPGCLQVGPIGGWDGLDDAPGQAVLLSSLRPGLQAVCRNLVPQRLGAAQRLTITLPDVAQPHDATALHHDYQLLLRARMSEALALAAWLLDHPPTIGQLSRRDAATWQWALPTGQLATLTIAGMGPLPDVLAQSVAGAVHSDCAGRVTLTAARGATKQVRHVDTAADIAPFWRLLGDAGHHPVSWPNVPVAAAVAVVDIALAQANRARWQPITAQWHSAAPVRWSAPSAAAPPPLPWLGPALQGDLLLRLAAVHAGLRDACSYEHPAPALAAAIGQLAAQLGLHCSEVHGTQAQRPFAPAAMPLLIVAKDAATAHHIGQRETRAQYASAAEVAPLHRALGADYGVPGCCIAAFIRMEQAQLQGVYLPAVTAATRGVVSPWANRRLPGAPTLHVPCSWACAATARLGAQAVQALARLSTANLAQISFLSDPEGVLAPWRDDIAAWQRLASPQLQADAYMQPHRAPLLMADWTRLVALVGAQTTAHRGPTGERLWRAVAGRAVASGQWLLADTASLRQWAQDVAMPLDVALQTGSELVISTVDNGHGPHVTGINGQAIAGPPLLWIPFGLALP